MKKTMKKRITATAASALLGASILIVKADCDYIQSGSDCGSKPQAGTCTNGCVCTVYTPSGPSETCTEVEPGGCGEDKCTPNKVTEYEQIFYFSPITVNGQCSGCGLPMTGGPMIPDGTCEQDYIPSDANQCGNCN
jgi:hypothetical protein